jgi:hypothetical protein
MRFDQGAAYSDQPPLVNAATADEAAGRICELLDDPAALDRLAAAATAWVDANHAARTVAARVLADYARLGFGPRG